MTHRVRAAPRPLRLAGVVRGFLLLVLIVAGAVTPPRLRAQTTQSILQSRHDGYESAKADYEAARSAYRVAERPFSSAMGDLRQARASGDRDAYERALSLVQDRARVLDPAEKRMDRTKAALDSARQALIQVIEVRQDDLLRQMDEASSSQERNDLNTRWTDLNRELQGLETEAGRALHPEPVLMPDLQFDLRDDPDEILLKAEQLERFAATADTAIQETDGQIKDLQDRLRRQRQRADLMAGVERFDDTRLPVVTNAPPGNPSTAADSTGAGARPMTLEERIQSLKDYRAQLERYRDQALIRAKEFRKMLGAVA